MDAKNTQNDTVHTDAVHRIHLTDLIFHLGSHADLSEKTARATFSLEGPHTWTAIPVAPLTAAAAGLPPLDEDPNCKAGSAHDFIAKTVKAEHLTVAHCLAGLVVWLQKLAYEPVDQARVIACSGQKLTLALPWVREHILRDSLAFAVQWLSMHLGGAEDPEVLTWRQNLDRWLLSAQNGGFPPNTLRFVTAAWARNIPVTLMPSFVQLGWGCQAQRLDSSFTGHTSTLATRIARNKVQTKQLLAQALLPVPQGGIAANEAQALQWAEKIGWPVAVKPSNQDQGHGVTAGIVGKDLLLESFRKANGFSPQSVIVEKHIAGNDHRLLVVGGQLMAATRRTPGGVWGDGVQTVTELLAQLNADPRRGSGKRSLLIRIELDAEATECLTSQGLQPHSVPATGQFVPLRRTANISTGGTADDVTSVIHPDNRSLAIRAARMLGLDIAGVDFLCPDISQSWRLVGGAICEVNAQPGFRVHWLAQPDRDLNGEVLDGLFQNKTPRIPTTAITGTNGKSTVARMLHHVWTAHGTTAGVCTTQGTWVGQELIHHDNLSGLPGALMLLQDSSVQAAVLELPRKGLIRFGHPCDHYDVAALLNVQDDHIGVEGVNTLAHMAVLKAEVLKRAKHAVVVNAEDPLCLGVLPLAGAKRHILVGRDAQQRAMSQHLLAGGDGVFVMNKEGTAGIVMASGTQARWLMPLADIPATMQGLLKFNETNALFAAALAWAHGIPPPVIRRALSTFENSVQNNPGRYNFLTGFPFQVMLDYGHNPSAVQALCAVVQQQVVTGQRHLLNLKLGNRHRSHLTASAPLLSQTFDRFVMGCDLKYVQNAPDYAGPHPAQTMLRASQEALLAMGVAAQHIVCEENPHKAFQMALSTARPGDFLVILAEPWFALPKLQGP
jgi:cyanophycin synthetase